VVVELHQVVGNGYIVRVRDDGVGFPEGLDYRRTETLGMQIVNTLVNQLDGAIELAREKGTAFTISFQEIKDRPRT
jgi:two-component sensor histidine kinase